jgi:hypothetical protein
MLLQPVRWQASTKSGSSRGLKVPKPIYGATNCGFGSQERLHRSRVVRHPALAAEPRAPNPHHENLTQLQLVMARVTELSVVMGPASRKRHVVRSAAIAQSVGWMMLFELGFCVMPVPSSMQNLRP